MQPTPQPRRSQALLGYYFYRVPGRITARILAHTPITPTQVTLLSFLLALIASAFYLGGTQRYLLIGAIIFYFSKMIDYADGELARMKNMTSTFGAWADSYSDVYKIILPLLTIGIGGYSTTNRPVFLLLSFVATLLFLLFMVTRLFLLVLIKEKQPADFQITKKTHLGWTTPASILIIFLTLFNQPYYLLLFFSTFGAIPLLLKLYISYTTLRAYDKKTKNLQSSRNKQ